MNLNQNEELFKSKQKTQETRDALKRKFNFSLDTINLQDEINSLEKQNQHKLSQISSNQQSIALIAASLQIEEKKNYSSYTLVQQERIKKFKRAIQIFIKNFGEFNRLIENINNIIDIKEEIKNTPKFIDKDDNDFNLALIENSLYFLIKSLKVNRIKFLEDYNKLWLKLDSSKQYTDIDKYIFYQCFFYKYSLKYILLYII